MQTKLLISGHHRIIDEYSYGDGIKKKKVADGSSQRRSSTQCCSRCGSMTKVKRRHRRLQNIGFAAMESVVIANGSTMVAYAESRIKLYGEWNDINYAFIELFCHIYNEHRKHGTDGYYRSARYLVKLFASVGSQAGKEFYQFLEESRLEAKQHYRIYSAIRNNLTDLAKIT